MRRVLATLALAGLACGGDSNNGAGAAASASEIPAATVAEMPAATNGAATHKVDMVITDAGEYRFVPEQLTIKTGDVVQWINVSGGPHNVQFKTDGIPAGAADVLTAAMGSNVIGPLSGMLMTAPNAVYELSFEGAPAGEYQYTCTPHELLGMNATLTITN